MIGKPVIGQTKCGGSLLVIDHWFGFYWVIHVVLRQRSAHSQNLHSKWVESVEDRGSGSPNSVA
jgi:hypothetical protein